MELLDCSLKLNTDEQNFVKKLKKTLTKLYYAHYKIQLNYSKFLKLKEASYLEDILPLFDWYPIRNFDGDWTKIEYIGDKNENKTFLNNSSELFDIVFQYMKSPSILSFKLSDGNIISFQTDNEL